MKESFSHGDQLAKRAQETLTELPLTDSRVQVFLAQLAFPGDAQAISKWIEEDEGGSLSSKFRAYVEDPRTPANTHVDIHSTDALAALLASVSAHAPENTLH